MKTSQGCARLARDRAGVTAIEFALLAPVFFTLLLGIFNLGHMAYTQAVLNGAVQSAARSAALEAADTGAVDLAVRTAVTRLVPGATITFERKSYLDFADIERPERFTDSNGNGTCDDDEPYSEENGVEGWQDDVAMNGNGSANDVTLYTVSVTYEPFVKIPIAPANWGNTTLTATAVRKNQPFASQQDRQTVAGGTCE